MGEYVYLYRKKHLKTMQSNSSKKILYIISNVDRSLAFEWLTEKLILHYDISFILLNPQETRLSKILTHYGAKTYNLTYFNKKNLLKTFLKVLKIVFKEKPDIVHCHLFDASIIGLCAAYFAGINKRIYTRHHSSFHHEYFPSAVKYDKLINFFATDIIAVSENVKRILIEKENVSSKKISVIYHGLKFSDINTIDEKKIRNIKNKYSISNLTSPIIGIISRYTTWKGVQYAIPAFKQVLHTYPDALLILANAGGDYKKQIHNLLNEIPSRNYIEIVFEEDIFALYKIFNLFIHTPINEKIEAFGQIYIEALACKTPSIFTLSGIAKEFIVNEKNALVVPYMDSDSIYNAIMKMLTNENQRNTIIENGYADVLKKFDINDSVMQIQKLYSLS